MTELVEQRSSTDCAIAGIAMYTGLTYEEVVSKAYAYSIKTPMRPSDIMVILRAYDFNPVILTAWRPRFAGIIIRPSSSHETSSEEVFSHCVYWTGGGKNGRCLDPLANTSDYKAYTDHNSASGPGMFITECNNNVIAGVVIDEIECKRLSLMMGRWLSE